jgi:16S rRNA (uracil1498-N3)-methyltransferase
VPSPLRVPLRPIAKGEVLLDAATSRYVARVHRLGVGSGLVVFDPEARVEANAVVAEVGRRVRCVVDVVRPARAIAMSRVTLVQALGKGDKPEHIVRDGTALGVERIVFTESARSVVRSVLGSGEGPHGDAKRKRWQRVAIESARQSKRGDVPLIEGPMAFSAALEVVNDADCRLCLAPGGPTRLGAALGRRGAGGTLALLVGPEGGFDDAELAAAQAAGCAVVSFGDLVLRTETAAVAALGAIAAFAAEK